MKVCYSVLAWNEIKNLSYIKKYIDWSSTLIQRELEKLLPQ